MYKYGLLHTHARSSPICKLCKHFAAFLIDQEGAVNSQGHDPCNKHATIPSMSRCLARCCFDVSMVYAVSSRGDLFLAPSSSAGRTRHLLLAHKRASATWQMPSMRSPNPDHHLRILSVSPLHLRSEFGAVLCCKRTNIHHLCVSLRSSKQGRMLACDTFVTPGVSWSYLGINTN